jgi:hypothetical protein
MSVPKFTKKNAKKMAQRSHAARYGKPADSADGSAVEQAAVGTEKLTYRELIEWVWEHLAEKTCPAAPNRKARELWRYAKKNPDGFLDKYVPMLMRGDAGDKSATDTADVYEADYRKILEDMLAEIESRTKENACPHCNGTGERPNDGSVKAPARAVQPGSQSVQR